MADNLSLERTDRITGSRIAGILGLSPYNTRAQVMREMVRQHFWADDEFTGNYATDWGAAHEQDAIEAYQLLHGLAVENALDEQLTIVGGPDHQFAVTPDGWVTPRDMLGKHLVDGDDGLVETKAPFRATYTHHEERPDYQAQMALSCFVAERPWCDFVVWRTTGLNVSRFYLPDNWYSGDVAAECERFLEEYAQIIEDDDLAAAYLEPVNDRRTDPEWAVAEAVYFEVLADAERTQQALAAAKRDLETLAGNRSVKGASLHLVYTPPSRGGKGQISYKSALETLVPEDKRTPAILDTFRGKASGSGAKWSYRYIGEKED